MFTMIQTAGDVKPAADRLLLLGYISRQEYAKYTHTAEEALQDPLVAEWFSDDWKTLKEAEIILPGGGMKRPDRIMTRKDQTIVVDYKFGSRIEPSYESQVREYAGLLQSMGYLNVEGYLWYVNLRRVVSCKV
jgi:CRISPR/Cas system-associated exonuclease Cas4 (RecB family)